MAKQNPPRVKKSIVWLASYPKSGNTWTRVFLANYLFNRDTPMPINQIHRLGIGDAIAKTYRIASAGQPLDTADYLATLALRPKVLSAIVANGADVNFVKTHNIRRIAHGVELIPSQLTRAAVYIIRNPLDMALSYARHYGLTAEETVLRLGHRDNAVAGDEHSVTQFLGTWSDHVVSWTGIKRFPVLVLRYEDLHADPQGEFSRLLTHLGLPVDESRRDRAIRFSSFDELSKQETEQGFVEKSSFADKFFHSGRTGGGKAGLTPKLADRLCRDHRKVMKRFGYI